MRQADHVKPISYLKSDAAQIVKDLTASGEPLLTILALGQKDIEQGKFKDADAFLAELDDLDRKEKIG